MDAKAVATVGKLVNQATSDLPEEADAAARAALARIAKAGGTFEGYLGLCDPSAVFQSGLVRVADRHARQAPLSEPAKRELFAKLLAEIARMYGGTNAGPVAGEGGSPGSGTSFSPAPGFFSRFPWLSAWGEDWRGALRTYVAGALFGAFAAVAGTLLAAFASAVAGGSPDWLSPVPVAWVMAAFWAAGAAFRVYAEFRPGLREIVARFP